MSDIKNKIMSIDKKILTIDEKMKQLMLQKKDLIQQKKDLEEQEILDVVRNSGASAESLNSDLELVKLLKDNNLTKDDIMELIAPTQNTEPPYPASSPASSYTTNVFGGIKDENN